MVCKNSVWSKMNISNATGNPSRGCSTSVPDSKSAVGLSVAFGIVLLFAVVGNAFVIWFARRSTRTKYTAFNYFLISMATADILDVISSTPIHWIFLFFGVEWVGGVMGEISCKVVYFLVNLSVYASVLTLVTITTDRYFAIRHVMYIPLSRRRMILVLSGIWALAGLFAAVQLYKFNVYYIRGRYYCYSSWNIDTKREIIFVKYEMVLTVAMSYGFPLVVMVIMYAFIIRELWKRLDIFAHDQNSSLERRIQRQNRPLVKMFVTLVTVFAICWFPVHVNHLLIAFDYQQYLCLPNVVPLTFYLLAHANAAINPFMYIIFIENFRNALANHVCGRLTRLITFFNFTSPRTSYSPNAVAYVNGAIVGEGDNGNLIGGKVSGDVIVGDVNGDAIGGKESKVVNGGILTSDMIGGKASCDAIGGKVSGDAIVGKVSGNSIGGKAGCTVIIDGDVNTAVIGGEMDSAVVGGEMDSAVVGGEMDSAVVCREMDSTVIGGENNSNMIRKGVNGAVICKVANSYVIGGKANGPEIGGKAGVDENCEYVGIWDGRTFSKTRENDKTTKKSSICEIDVQNAYRRRLSTEGDSKSKLCTSPENEANKNKMKTYVSGRKKRLEERQSGEEKESTLRCHLNEGFEGEPAIHLGRCD
ncbi:galanin receptor 2b isoform X2 [Nematostella vectensis]|uniref:galanin receptor 2b isoform X2 n=1 Tax=Nematostella vectensis TaxID=45351 RepID=UPI0020774076|nr:galanin receptor 2b isoform X2 [Nematostella vectensis]